MSDTRRDPQQRARELTGHGFGCGTRIAGSSTDDRLCAECADIAAALQSEYERGKRETVTRCGSIIEDADDFCCFGERLDLVLKLYREFGMEYGTEEEKEARP